VVAGRTDLTALAAIVAHAGRVVCGDTGVAHLATAFGIPSVVLFGPTSPATWGPPAERAHHRVLWHGTTGDPHADRPDPGLLAIEPAQVIQELAAP
jgi:ADP-heptose:LPS heptosyltransferase